MSLKVWLPLDGDLRNLGCSDVTITNGGTIDNNGKIGKCYKNVNAILTNLGGIKVYPMTICFWMKTADASSTWQQIFMIDNESNSQIHGIYVADSARIKYEYNPSLNVNNAAPTTWHHYCFIINSGNSTAYYDGTLMATSTETVTADIIGRLRIGTGANIYLNDMRIYDHCLSAAEVHEIAQGLILHYKLDGFMGGVGENLLMNSRTFGTGWSGVGTTTQNAYENNFAVKYYDYSSGTNNYADAVVYSNVTTVQPGETYTGSFWAKADTSSSLFCYFYNNTSGVVQVSSIKRSNGTTGSGSDGNSSFTIDNVWRKYWVTWTFGSSGTAALKTFIVCRLLKGSSGISITKVKLEKGDKATEWVPHINELGINTTKIEDSSGYGHNATLTNTLLTANTPRYSIATTFDGTNYGNIQSTVVEGSHLSSEYTWAGWIYRDYTDATARYLYNGITKIYLNTNFSTRMQWNHSKSDGTSSTNTSDMGIIIPYREWTHLVWTFKDGYLKIYINGEYKNYSDRTGTGQFIKGYTNQMIGTNTSSSGQWIGNISDMRIYTTALLDNDIKLLYNMGSRIDNLGGVHSFELEEKDNNLLAGTLITSAYNNKVNPYNRYNSNGEMYFDTNTTSAGSDYISINPINHTYYYDFDISLNAGNKFYIGFERYDADKTSRSNNATIYICDTRPTEDINHKHIFGTVDLSTDGVNPCAFIALRILNGWTGTTSGVVGIATIHSMSLREVSTIQNPKLYKNGILLTDEFKEYQKASFYKNGFVEATEFIEI